MRLATLPLAAPLVGVITVVSALTRIRPDLLRRVEHCDSMWRSLPG